MRFAFCAARTGTIGVIMRVSAILVLALSMSPAAWSDSMRCGQSIVNEENTPSEILNKCGDPQRKEVSTEDVIVRNPAGYTRKTGVQVTERWYYQRSSRALPMLVTVVDGKVKSIERTE
jgi:hypothetical protein